MLTPAIVGAIARRDLDPVSIGPEDARALVRHDLAYAVCGAVAGDAGLPDVLPTAARGQAMRSILVSATASRVSALLAAADVRAIAYKGPALAVQTTGTWLGRGSADVDLVIDVADAAAADAALRAGGAWSRVGYESPPTRWERFHRGERAYSGLPVTIDLHWRIDSGPGYFHAPFADLWSRRERVEMDGLDVEAFDRVDALLTTAVHGAKERWVRWFWALDAVRQVEQLDPSLWPEARARASASGCERALDLCLGVAQACGGHLPDGVEPSPRMSRLAEQWLIAGTEAGPVVWTPRASLARRRARWILADRPTAAVGGFTRAVARLVADRRAPGAPQRHRSATPPEHAEPSGTGG